MTCTATYTTTQADLNAGSITNVGSVSGTPPTGPAVTDTDDAVVTADQTPSISIDKTASPTTFGAVGTPISYTFLVTNNGNVTLDGVTVSDPHAGLSPISCAPAQGSSLAPGATMTCTATYTTTQADLNAGSITNVGSVSGTPPTGPAVTDTDDAVVTADQTSSPSPSPTTSPTTSPPSTLEPTSPAPPPPPGPLAFTGADVTAAAIAAAMLLIVAGSGLILMSRRQRRSRRH